MSTPTCLFPQQLKAFCRCPDKPWSGSGLGSRRAPGVVVDTTQALKTRMDEVRKRPSQNSAWPPFRFALVLGPCKRVLISGLASSRRNLADPRDHQPRLSRALHAQHADQAHGGGDHTACDTWVQMGCRVLRGSHLTVSRCFPSRFRYISRVSL